MYAVAIVEIDVSLVTDFVYDQNNTDLIRYLFDSFDFVVLMRDEVDIFKFLKNWLHTNPSYCKIWLNFLWF